MVVYHVATCIFIRLSMFYLRRRRRCLCICITHLEVRTLLKPSTSQLHITSPLTSTHNSPLTITILPIQYLALQPRPFYPHLKMANAKKSKANRISQTRSDNQ